MDYNFYLIDSLKKKTHFIQVSNNSQPKIKFKDGGSYLYQIQKYTLFKIEIKFYQTMLNVWLEHSFKGEHFAANKLLK